MKNIDWKKEFSYRKYSSGNTNISKLTDEEIAIATSKGWTLI